MILLQSLTSLTGINRLKLGATLLIVSLAVSCGSGNKEPMPVGEANFISKINSFVSNYNSAVNKLAKSTLRSARGAELRQVLPDLNFIGWVGTVQEVTKTPTGETAIAIQLPGSSITVRTLNNKFGDVSTHTLIEADSPLAGKVGALAKGDKVNFDGSFILDGVDWIKEIGANEHDSMTKPEYLVAFKDLAKK